MKRHKEEERDGDNNEPKEEREPGMETEQNPSAIEEDIKVKGEGKKPEDMAEKYRELWNNYLRLRADMENARKRWDRERLELLKFGNFNLLKDFLVIADELEQALKVTKEHAADAEIMKGVEMTYNNFMSLLRKSGVSLIEAEGRKFDPHSHEIVAQREVDSDELEHVVLTVAQNGYLLEDKVLRTAKVIVGVKKEDTSGNAGEQRD